MWSLRSGIFNVVFNTKTKFIFYGPQKKQHRYYFFYQFYNLSPHFYRFLSYIYFNQLEC